MPHNLNSLLQHGTLTGSRAFNCATEESDWDIVITESMLPSDLLDQIILSATDFTNEPTYHENSIAGYSIDEYELPDLGEDFIEYDQHTIWGPLTRIIKYLDFEDNIINLFVYQDTDISILEKFKKLNNLIVFVFNDSLKDKQTRIEAFIELTDKLDITSHELI